MGISVYNIKRWIKMVFGKSIYHVDQGLGQAIDKGGYYNDLTNKVLLGDKNVDSNGIPFLVDFDGSKVQMPTMIFQYGLGAYDLWLLTNQELYLKKAIICAEWAVNNQNEIGAWNNFSHIYPQYPYSAMSQGEGISLLLRLYKETGEIKYFNSAVRANKYMTTSTEDGGVLKVDGGEYIYLEYIQKSIVLNGWIFALFGLYDFSLSNPSEIISNFWIKSVNTLIKHIPEYDNGYWSMYNTDGLIASPFYHKLHIAQLLALYHITGESIFSEYAQRWTKYQKRPINKMFAFVKKAIQKIQE